MDITDDQFRIISENLNIDGIDRCEMKSFKRLVFGGALYTTTKNTSKRADYCVCVDSLHGLINHFLKIRNEIYIVMQRVDHLFSPFYDENNPQIQSKTFLCNVTDDIFLTKLDQIQKVAFIKINEDLCFISQFSISHLFL